MGGECACHFPSFGGLDEGVLVSKHTLEVLGAEKRPEVAGVAQPRAARRRCARARGGAGSGYGRRAGRRASTAAGASSESRAGRQRRGVEAAAAPERGWAAAPPRAVPGSAGR